MTPFTLPTAPTLDHVDVIALERTVLPDGGPFPPSYRAFVRAAGWGRLFGLWLVYPPVQAGYANGWPGRTSRLTERFHAAYAYGRAHDFDWMVEPDGDWSLAERLHVFAWSENGDALLWELGSRDAHCELVIWESRGLNSLRCASGKGRSPTGDPSSNPSRDSGSADPPGSLSLSKRPSTSSGHHAWFAELVEASLDKLGVPRLVR